MIGFFLGFLLSLSVMGSTEFADDLMRQQDHFRAITEYKRVAHYSNVDSLKNYCFAQIAKAYRRSSRFESAILYSGMLLTKPDLPPNLRFQSNLNLGLSYLEYRMPSLSLRYFDAAAADDTSEFSLLCTGLAELEMKNWSKASASFRKAEHSVLSSSSGIRFPALSDSIMKFRSLPRKSPFLASSLSFVIPGSGQFYSGHTYDAIQAFLMVASFAFASYAMYEYEDSNKDHLEWTYVSFSITAIFHTANVLGAHRTAKYRNWRMHRDFVDFARDAVMLLEPE